VLHERCVCCYNAIVTRCA